MATYVPLLILFVVAAAVVGVFVVMAVLVGAREPNPTKPLPFECGNPSEGARTLRPSVKFYLTALLFVVFDVEAVLIYPWAVGFRELGWAGLGTMAAFIGLLAVALAYAWRKGALEWER